VPFNRKRGAQPKNRNALKHGFYSEALTPDARKILKRAERIDSRELQHEIDLMRTAMFRLTEIDPKNVTVLVLTGRLLVKMIAVKYGMSKEQEDGIHDSLRTLLLDLQPAPAPAGGD